MLLGFCGPAIAAESSNVEFIEGSVGGIAGCRVSPGENGSDAGIAGVKSPGIGAITRKCAYSEVSYNINF